MALAWASPLTAQEAIAPPAAQSAAASAGEMVLVLGELSTRMTVPVHIAANGAAEGPWPFIVDTGAERTVVSRELAGRLGLAAGPDIRVVAMSGVSVVPTVLVPTLSVSSLSRHAITAPALHAEHLGAAGMVGIDALQDHAVAIDFDQDRITVRPSRKRGGKERAIGDVVVTARSRYGQLIVTDAHYNGRRIAVVVDTGTPISVGNPAFLKLMRARENQAVTMVSATGGEVRADMAAIRGLEVGGIRFSEIQIAISDAPPFHRFGLRDKPALLLGMDMMRLFRQVQIDFANREIRFTLPRGMAARGSRRDGA